MSDDLIICPICGAVSAISPPHGWREPCPYRFMSREEEHAEAESRVLAEPVASRRADP